MPIKTDVSKLKRENEILRSEINALRSSVRPTNPYDLINPTIRTPEIRAGTGASKTKETIKYDLRNDTLVLDFKYLRSDLTRTMILTTLATIAVIALSILEPKTPLIRQIISSINI